MQITLLAGKPFNFHSVVNSHGWRHLAPFGFYPDTGTLSNVLRFTSGRVEELKIRETAGMVSARYYGHRHPLYPGRRLFPQ